METVEKPLIRTRTALADTRPPALAVQDLHVDFETAQVLRGVHLEVRRGETLALIGGSGSGKSTLLRSMIGALPPTSGSVELLGEDLYAVPPDILASLRTRIGVLFQAGALFSSMTVGENLALLLREHRDLDEEIIRIIVKMKLELVGLRDFESLMPAELSGGMRKRVGLARALTLDPEIIFYDEPSAGLDPIVEGVIDKLILDLAQSFEVTSVVVTHHMRSAFHIADRIAMLHQGQIIALGTADEVRNSENPVVQQFVTGSPDGPIPLRCSRVDYREDLLSSE